MMIVTSNGKLKCISKIYSTECSSLKIKLIEVKFLNILGYIVSALGPYFADSKNNDAEIIKKIIINNNDGLHDWLQPGDILVVDRGFRDCLPIFENFGYSIHVPNFLQKHQKQFTTEEAPETETNDKFSIRIRFDSARLSFYSIQFDLLFKIFIQFDSIRFGNDNISFDSIRFDSIWQR